MANQKLKDIQSLVSHMLGRREKRMPAWRQLSRWLCPGRGSFDDEFDSLSDFSGLLRFTQPASQAVLKGASGMTSGMTPRNVSWFKPSFMDESLLEIEGARPWLDEIDYHMKDCLQNGGFYQAIQSFNMDLLWAGCALLYCERADTNPLAYECQQIGTFAVETDRQGRLLAVARRLVFTVEELVSEFGKRNVSLFVKDKLQKQPWERVYVWQLTRYANKGRFPVASLFWEEGQDDRFLRESGYNEMPFFYTVWNEGEPPYGSGPGDAALPDARQMDELERRKLEGIAKITDPPVAAHTSLAGHLDLAPGALNYMPDRQYVQPILEMGPFAQFFANLQQEIALVKERLNETLYAKLFESVPLDQRPRDMSATEYLERKNEALQQLGPVISAYEPNVLTPLLYRTVQALDRMGLLPPAPQGLGKEPLLRMEFISPMANAMRMTSSETTRALFQDVASMAQASQNPALLDKIDTDQMVDILATGLGAPGSIINSDEKTQAIREQRAQAQMQEAQMQQAMQIAQIAQAGAGALAQGAQANQTLAETEEAPQTFENLFA